MFSQHRIFVDAGKVPENPKGVGFYKSAPPARYRHRSYARSVGTPAGRHPNEDRRRTAMTPTMQTFFSFCGLRRGRRGDQEYQDGMPEPPTGLAALPRAMHPAGPRRTAAVDDLDLRALRLEGRAVPAAAYVDEDAQEIADAKWVLAMTQGMHTWREASSDRYRMSTPSVDGGVQTPVQHEEQNLAKESIIKTTPDPINATAANDCGPPSGGPPQSLAIDAKRHTAEKGGCDAGRSGFGAPSPECEALLASIHSAAVRRLCELTMIDEEGNDLSESVFGPPPPSLSTDLKSNAQDGVRVRLLTERKA